MATFKQLTFSNFVHAYLITDENTLLFDTGAAMDPAQLPAFLEENGVDPTSVDYIVVSHAHWDHAQFASYWKNLSDAKLICHRKAVDWLKTGTRDVRYSYGSEAQACPEFIEFMETQSPMSILPVEPDIVVGDEDFDLHPYGIAGKLIYTPGHDDASISLILDDRRAFTADTVVDLSCLPPLAKTYPEGSISLNWIRTDDAVIAASARRLLEEADIFYGGHGRACTPDDVIPLVQPISIAASA